MEYLREAAKRVQLHDQKTPGQRMAFREAVDAVFGLPRRIIWGTSDASMEADFFPRPVRSDGLDHKKSTHRS
jgi:hypothetical protein